MFCVAVRPPSVAYRLSSRSLKLRVPSICWVVAITAIFLLLGAAQAQTATTTSLSLSSSSVSSGTMVTLTATVTGIPTGASGTVRFCDANYIITVPTPGGSASACEDIHIIGQAQLITTTTTNNVPNTGLTVGNAYYRYFPGVGSHSYKAVFMGTTSYQPSTSSASALTVTPTLSSVTTTTSAVTSTGANTAYFFSATVSAPYANAGVPAGTVNFVNTSNPTLPTVNNIVTTATLVPNAASTVAFGTEAASNTQAGPTTVVTGDFNNDGYPDIAVADYVGASNAQTVVQVFLNNGSGGFPSSASYAIGIDGASGVQTHPMSIVTGDFNGDGFLDLAVTDYAGTGYISVLLNNGDGTYATAVTFSAGTGNKGYNPNYLAIGDFNGDGNLDLAATMYGANSSTDPGYVDVYLGSATGTFTYNNSYATGYSPEAVAVGDFNHDGFPDLVVANFTATTANPGYETISVLLNNGSSSPGTFGTQTTESTLVTGVTSTPRALAVGDMNSDGYPDVVVGDYNNATTSNDILVFLNGGASSPGISSTFTAYSGTGVPYLMTIADINGDGIPDVVYDSFSKGLAYNLGTGTGALNAYVISVTLTASSVTSLALADFNGDGVPDFVVPFNSNNAGTTIGSYLGTWTASATATSGSTNVVGTGNVSGGVYNPYLEAIYSSSTSVFNASTGPATYHTDDSDKATPTVTISASPAVGATSAQQFTLTATVSPFNDQGWLNNGDTITFKDTTTSTTLGSGTLSSGVATLIVSAGSISGYTNAITASFVDTVNGATTPVFNSVTSSALNYPIGTAPTTSFTIPTHYTYDTPFNVSMTSNSSGAITYSLVSGSATVSSGGLVTLTPGASGTVVVQATQAAHNGTPVYIGAVQTASFSVLAGSVWVGNTGVSSLTADDLAGTAISTGSGFTGGGLGTVVGPQGAAFDSSGHLWIANTGTTGISEFTAAGTASGSSPYVAGGVSSPSSLAVDGLGQIWIANGNSSVTALSNTGSAITPSTGFTAGGTLATPVAVGIDISGNVWFANSGDNSITEIIGVAAPAAPPATALTNGTTGARP